MIRIFVAYPAAEYIRETFKKVFEQNVALSGLRWTIPINQHLTLFFIGEVDAEAVPDVIAVIQRIALRHSGFQLQFDRLTLAGKPSKPSMLWARFYKNAKFRELHDDLCQELKSFLPVEPTHPDPIPHITLARLAKSVNREKIIVPEADPGVLSVTRLELWQTVHQKKGLVYERLYQSELEGN